MSSWGHPQTGLFLDAANQGHYSEPLCNGEW